MMPVRKIESFLFKFFILTLILLASHPAHSGVQGQLDDVSQPLHTKIDKADVVVNGHVIFEVAGIRAYRASRRAREISEKITSLAKDSNVNPDDIQLVDKEDRTLIQYKDDVLFSVFLIDANLQGINNRHITAETLGLRVKEAIRDYRLDRSPKVVQQNVLLALVRTAIVLVALALVIWLFRKLDKLLERSFKRRIRKLEAKSMRIVQSEQVWRVVRTIFILIKVVLVLFLVYFFITRVLELFPWTRYVGNQLLEMVIDPLQLIGSSLIGYLPSLFFLAILFLVARYLLKLIYSFFEAVSRENLRLANFEAEWAWPTYRIVRLVVIIFALVVAYPYIPGSDSQAFKGISLFVGVLLSLGSTSVISNIIAGYTMTYRRAFRVGDRVKIGQTIGTVTEIRLLVTNLVSLKNEKIVIPNSTILNSEIINYTSMLEDKGIILHTSVGIGYEVPWRQVEAMLLEAARRTDGLSTDPKPFVLQKALADFAVTYELNAYCRDEKSIPLMYTELHRNIQDVFNEYGVQIMTPNYVADTPEPKIVAPEEWYAEPAVKPEEGKA
jgi:small-conductance mechanosensitive channel